MRGLVLCILSHVRSGSTLFGQLLNAHSNIVLAGELQWLPAYVLNDRRYYNPPFDLRCACGETVPECEFWRAVTDEAGRPLASMTMMPKFFTWTGPGAEKRSLHERMIRRIVETYPRLYRHRIVQTMFGGKEVATDNMAVFDAILRYSGAKYVVDTSKRIFRFRTLYEWFPHRVKIVVLQRDYRAVIYSQMKRDISFEAAAQHWVRTENQIDSLSAGIPSSAIAHMKYEDLCQNPESEVRRICQFLEVPFEERMLTRPTHGLHDIGGSPSKLEAGRKQIKLDAEYLTAFSESQSRQLQRLVGRRAQRLTLT